MKMITIVCEALAKEAVKKLLHEAGAHGWTIFDVEGEGAHGRRPADIREYANIQVEAIVPPEVSERVLSRLQQELFPCYAIIAFESEVRVLRPAKF